MTSEAPKESITLTTSDGLKLVGELAIPANPVGAAVLAHPHPLHGGNMRSMVPGELINELPARNFATLRFNFRGVGASEGSFDDGDGERNDVVAAIETLHELTEGLPLLVFGSSFGGDTSLSVNDPRIDGWCALAPPLRDEKLQMMQQVASDERPKLLVVAERDNFRQPDDVDRVINNWKSTSMRVVPGADHYFVGRLHIAIQHACDFAETFIR